MREGSIRRERLSEAMREVLSELLLTESKDPRLHGVVISAVELSGDLKVAQAFFSVFGDQERERQAGDALAQARGFLRRELGKRMRMHNPPELHFHRDKGFERSDRLQRIFDHLDHTTQEAETGSGSSDTSPDEASSPTPDPGPRAPGGEGGDA